MLSEGFPITEFIGGRKNLDSTYTKLLSQAEATAAALYDKLRFRIVTRTRDDMLPVLLYLTEQLFPFNYVVPKQSTNTIFDWQRCSTASRTGTKPGPSCRLRSTPRSPRTTTVSARRATGSSSS